MPFDGVDGPRRLPPPRRPARSETMLLLLIGLLAAGLLLLPISAGSLAALGAYLMR